MVSRFEDRTSVPGDPDFDRYLTALEFRGLLLRSPEQGMGHQGSTLPASRALKTNFSLHENSPCNCHSVSGGEVVGSSLPKEMVT